MRILKKFGCLPEQMRNSAVLEYYTALRKKMFWLFLKRIFDIVVSVLFICVLLPLFLVVAAAIKLDSFGSIIYKQSRITQYGRKFKIYKFRTMVEKADTLGTLVTVGNDPRITRVGKVLRKYRIDEIPQLFNILLGDMSFVGTRPEVEKYVNCYTDKMMATLLLPAGVTSSASIYYKDESQLLAQTENVDETYVQKILPAKMKYNLQYIENFSLWNDLKIMVKTVFAVCANKKIDLPENRKADVNA